MAGDLSGGLASAVMAITGNVAAGVIAFAPLGPEYAGRGVLAGMFTSIVAGLVASLTGNAPGMITGPKATTAMAFAALLSQLLATGRFDLSAPGHEELILSLAFAAVLVSGSVQILLGAFRVGAMVKFMPYPVVAGIRNTTAILLITSQIWPFLGVPRQAVGSFLVDLGQIQPATVLVAAATALIAWKGGRLMPGPAVPVVALVLGALLHHGLALVSDARLGPVLEPLTAALPRPDHAAGIWGALTDRGNLGLLAAVVSGGLAIAVLDSISALITLVSFQSLAERRFDANHQLVSQGVGSVAGALFGSLSTSGILARAAINHRAGGRTRASGVVNALGVLVLVALLARPLGYLPKAAIAGLIMVIASQLFDRWTVGQLEEALRADAEMRRDNVVSLAEMLFVVAVGVVWNLVAAVGAGVVLSVLVFVARMSRSPIRRVRTGAAVASRRRRDAHLTELLRREGHRIAVMELEGTVFFGSCDAVAVQAEALAAEGAEFVLLDLRRVRSVDATGYKVLGQTFQRLKAAGSTLAFSHVTPHGRGREMAEELVANGVPEARMFESTDRALEYFEEGLLLKLGADDAHASGWTLSDFAEAWEMSPEEADVLESHVVRRRYQAGELVFREGDEGRSMFLLGRGTADVVLRIPGDEGHRRVATCTAGTVFGEMALLDGKPRAAGVQATAPLEVYELTVDAFQRLGERHPEVGMKVQAAIGRYLGSRLRGANEVIMELES